MQYSLILQHRARLYYDLIPIKYLPVNKAVFPLNKIYLTIILISAKQNYFQETTFNSEYKAEYNSVKYFVDCKKYYFYFSILNLSYIWTARKICRYQIPNMSKGSSEVINQTWADNTITVNGQKKNDKWSTHKNKGNAKRGVSPRLQI